jgi:hypothetical protein
VAGQTKKLTDSKGQTFRRTDLKRAISAAQDLGLSLERVEIGKDGKITILPVLAKTLAAGPCGDLHFIVSADGKPFIKGSFGNAFREACVKAGVRASAQCVRKLAATTMANNGATERQLEAVFGWTGGRVASHYTRAADRRRLAAGLGAHADEQGANRLPHTSRGSAGRKAKSVIVSRRFFAGGGRGRTRTYEGVSQRIYSPPPLPLGTLSRTSRPKAFQ